MSVLIVKQKFQQQKLGDSIWKEIFFVMISYKNEHLLNWSVRLSVAKTTKH